MEGTCPICGGALPGDRSKVELTYQGVMYVFCSQECLRVFEAYPEAYSGAEEPELKPLEDGL